MSLPLKDAHVRLTAETNVALDAHARVNGKKKVEMASEVLHEWAMNQLHLASVMQRMAAVEGIERDSEGRENPSSVNSVTNTKGSLP